MPGDFNRTDVGHVRWDETTVYFNSQSWERIHHESVEDLLYALTVGKATKSQCKRAAEIVRSYSSLVTSNKIKRETVCRVLLAVEDEACKGSSG